MSYIRNRRLVAGLLLAGSAACVDLDVKNPNAPDAEQALRTASDVEALIAGTYREWWNSQWSNGSMGPILSVQSFQHSAFPANFGMTMYSTFPREQIVNDPAHGFYNQWANPWTWNYRALAAARDGLIAIDEGRVELTAANEQRARAFARFMQGLSHATLAIMFDQAFVVDETIDTKEVLEAKPAAEVLAAALDYFDEAIGLAQGASFTVPETWASRPVTAAELIELAHSYKAMYRAALARTPEERQAVDWDAVIADVDAGVTSDWAMQIENNNWGAFGVGWYVHSISAAGAGLWSQMSYFILGMADQSGRYQRWLGYPLLERHPNLGSDASDPFIIETPDTRFPQGATLAEQRDNPGTYYRAAAATGMWGQPGRGTWRWSWYLSHRFLPWFTSFATNPDYPWVSAAGLQLLKAEGLYWKGDRGGAAEIINVTRTANGLNATDAAGTNTSCVPKLPDGSCGDLLEMLKWEKRLETVGQGLFGAPWYFDSRGWGDLYEGTQLELPVPCRESQVLTLDCYTFGGVGGPRAAPQSRYDFPGE